MSARAEGDAAVAVVIPAYEAADTIPAVVSGVLQALRGARVYVVDDGSRDKTGDKAAEEGRGTGVTVLTHPRNLGKGAALRTGIARALADGARVLVTLDADGQHAPAELPRLLAPLARGEADLVLGARARTAAMPWGRRCSNWLSATLASRIGGQPIADAQTGFRAFSRAVAQAARPAGSRYDFETAFLLQSLAQGFRVRVVPVSTIYDGVHSHFRSWADTWRLARVFARYGRRILLGAP
jgi:UDP-N-acetylglucosamine---dolichyl-phosphate N-acetylglucosaminyltransferase